jgi:1-acyl-sn-glycerol-3-phosphate acyltransferase
MKGAGISLGNCAFGLLFVPVGLTLFASCSLFHVGARDTRRAEEWSLYVCRLLLRALLRCTFWLSVEDAPTTDDWDALVPPDGGACMVMINHTSQFDGFFFAAMASPNVVTRCKSLMIGKAFSMPLFGTVFRKLGHQPVHFLKDEDGQFSVDKARQAPVNALVRAHLERGGLLTFCPEGAINKKDPKKVQPHRRGSFRQAIDLRLPIYGFSSYGNHDFWPNGCAIAGKKARIVCAIYAVDAWNDRLKSGEDVSETTTADLALLCEKTMQASVDGVAAKHARR